MRMWKGSNLLASQRRSQDRLLSQSPKSLIHPLRNTLDKHRRKGGDRRSDRRESMRNPLQLSLKRNRKQKARNIYNDRHDSATSPMQLCPRRKSAGKAGRVNQKQKNEMVLCRRNPRILVRLGLHCPWLIRRSSSGTRRCGRQRSRKREIDGVVWGDGGGELVP